MPTDFCWCKPVIRPEKMTLHPGFAEWKKDCAIVRAVKEINKMQVSVKIIPMKQAAEDMVQIRKKINTCEAELTQIRRKLTELEAEELDEVLGEITQYEKKLACFARHCTLFGTAIGQIVNQYERAEVRIVDYHENVERKALRESVARRNLRDLHCLFEKIM